MSTFIKTIEGNWINAAHIIWISDEGDARLTTGAMVRLGPNWNSSANILVLGQVS